MMNAVRNAPSKAGGAAGGAADKGVYMAMQGLIKTLKAGTTGGAAGAGKLALKSQLASGKLMMKTFPLMGMGIGKLASLAKPSSIGGLPKKLLSKTMGLAGINLSVSSLLRQSQIFTGFMGALFQILGGFVDVILAPFMPFFVGLMKKLASWIPKVREYAQKAYEWLSKHVFPKLREWWDFAVEKIRGVFGWAMDMLPKAIAFATDLWSTTISPMLTKGWEIIQSVWDWGKQHLVPPIVATVASVWTLIESTWNWLKDMWPTFKSIFDSAKSIFEQLLKFWMDDVLPKVTDLYDWILTNIGGFIVNVIDKYVEFLDDIMPTVIAIFNKTYDILVEDILKPLWKSIEPILTWFVDFVFDNFKTLFHEINVRVLPLIQSAVDILMPTVKLIGEKIEELLPKIKDVADIIWDILRQVWDFLEPVVKLLLHIIVWVVEKILLPIIMDYFMQLYHIWTKWIKPGFDWVFKYILNWDVILGHVVNPIIGAFEWAVNKVLDIVWIIQNWKEALTYAFYKYINPAVAKTIDAIPGTGRGRFAIADQRRVDEEQAFLNKFAGRDQVTFGRTAYDEGERAFKVVLDIKNGTEDESRTFIQEQDRKKTAEQKTEIVNLIASQASAFSIN